MLRLLLGAVLLVALSMSWRALGKPGKDAYEQVAYALSMSFPWRDFTTGRPWKIDPPPMPRAVPIPLGALEYGCKPGRDDTGDESCAPDELPRDVDLRTLASACTAMGVNEVSFDEYDYYVWSQRNLPSDQRPAYPEAPGGRRGTHPVVNVSFDDAVAYTRWLSERTAQKWRLPTEEEWEYAARAMHPDKPGGKEGPWWWGPESPTLNGRANCIACDARSDGMSAPVASFKANAFGLHDTSGNVSEWTLSIYTPDNLPATARSAESPRVRRGGSWVDSADDTRASKRRYSPPDLRYSVIGFRVCRE